MMMEEINAHFNGQLNLAISIFKGDYPKNFLHQLISSQLDMDRLDYLRRDSFYTGVTEGNIAVSDICTVKRSDTFFSARRLGIQSGRIFTGIICKQG